MSGRKKYKGRKGEFVRGIGGRIPEGTKDRMNARAVGPSWSPKRLNRNEMSRAVDNFILRRRMERMSREGMR